MDGQPILPPVGMLQNQLDSYVLAYIYQAYDQARKIISEQILSKVIDLLEATQEWTKRKELFEKLYLSNPTMNQARYLDPLISFGWIVMELPDTPTHPNQRYKITAIGRRLLSLLNKDLPLRFRHNGSNSIGQTLSANWKCKVELTKCFKICSTKSFAILQA